MSAGDTHYNQDDEIDLIELLQTIWEGKRQVLAVMGVSVSLALLAIFAMPDTYKVSTELSKAPSSIFMKYIPLNQMIAERKLDYRIDSETLFSMFIDEFSDYEELIHAIGASVSIKQRLDGLGLDEIEKRQRIVEHAKLFEIIAPTKKEPNWFISYQWHDPLEGRMILEKAIANVLEQVKKTLINDINHLASSIKVKKQRQKDTLTDKLSSIIEISQLSLSKRLQFLSEQSAIAKASGIKSNMLDPKALNHSSEKGLALQIMSSEPPFYLRGYKSIDEEIKLLTNRTEEQRYLMANGYVETKERLGQLKYDFFEKQLLTNLDVIHADDAQYWVLSNLEMAEIKQQKKPFLYLAMAILLGGMLGIMYVLIAEGFSRHKKKSEAV